MVRPTLALLALFAMQGVRTSHAESNPTPHHGGENEIRTSAAAFVGVATNAKKLAFIDTIHADGPATPIQFDVDTLRSIRLEVVSMEGEVVRTLATGLWAEGRHQLAWHGESDAGAKADQGTYMLRLTVGAPLPRDRLALGGE